MEGLFRNSAINNSQKRSDFGPVKPVQRLANNQIIVVIKRTNIPELLLFKGQPLVGNTNETWNQFFERIVVLHTPRESIRIGSMGGYYQTTLYETIITHISQYGSVCFSNLPIQVCRLTSVELESEKMADDFKKIRATLQEPTNTASGEQN